MKKARLENEYSNLAAVFCDACYHPSKYCGWQLPPAVIPFIAPRQVIYAPACCLNPAIYPA